MTRFKEQRRIDQAIRQGNIQELEWALDYCRSRMKAAVRKDHEKAWNKQVRNIEATLENAKHK